MKELYKKYIEDKSGNWSPTSKRSEEQRLNKIFHLIDGDPQKLWDGLHHYGSYTRLTFWTRISSFWDWVMVNNPPPPLKYKSL